MANFRPVGLPLFFCPSHHYAKARINNLANQAKGWHKGPGSEFHWQANQSANLLAKAPSPNWRGFLLFYL